MSRSAVLVLSLWWNGKWRSEEEESRAADSVLLEQCWLFTAQSFISKVEALWTFGGVLNSLAGNHRGRASVHTVNSTHRILQNILVHYRSSGLQQGSLHDIQGSLYEVWTHIWLMHVFSTSWHTLLDDLLISQWEIYFTVYLQAFSPVAGIKC